MRYVIMTAEQYETEGRESWIDEDGVIQYGLSIHQKKFPKARYCPMRQEVVLSDGGNLSKEEVLAYIEANWPCEEEENGEL